MIFRLMNDVRGDAFIAAEFFYRAELFFFEISENRRKLKQKFILRLHGVDSLGRANKEYCISFFFFALSFSRDHP
jgi:hypothetical protein